MTSEIETAESVELAYEQAVERVHFNFGFKRRSFMQLLGAGLLIAASAPALAQQRGGGRRGGGFGGSGAKTIGARINIGKDGYIILRENLCVYPKTVELEITTPRAVYKNLLIL